MNGTGSGPSRRGPHRETPLQRYLETHEIPAARIESKLRERLQGRCPSRQQFGRWRLGRTETRRKDMVRILWAVREASGNPEVRIEELFDLDPENADVWLD